MSNNTNTSWKSLGWRITRKILFYLLVAAAVWFGGTFAFYLMNIPETFTFFAGIFLLGAIIGGIITVILRELQFYFGGNNQNKQTQNENTETDY